MSTPTTIGTVETLHLYGWTAYGDGVVLPENELYTIRARLFGLMVARAAPVVQEYHSDLFHDAHWLDVNVKGVTGFDYLVRHSGTNIGESARIGVQIGAGRGWVLYRIEITEERGRWTATFTVIDTDTGSH